MHRLDLQPGPIDATIYRELQVGIGACLPKGWFGKDKEQGARLDSIVNKTLLTSRTNRIMGSLRPSDYLVKLENEAGLPPNWFDDIIATHLSTRSRCARTTSRPSMPRAPRPCSGSSRTPWASSPSIEPETLADYEPEPVA